MFYGEFEHSIDDKGRITVPAKFRAQLAAGVVVTKGLDTCLWLYPAAGWEELAARIKALPVTNPAAREFRRQVFGSASDDVPDKQGRINLPEYLLRYAGIDRNAVIVGLDSHCEIWNRDEWRARQERSHLDIAGRADMFASLGI